ncbi:MAG: polymer-forming cytoskeletal protein [Clostridium sp.]
MRENAKFQFNTFKAEGQYDFIQIEFDAILEGDVDANKIQSNGQPKIIGNVKTRELIFTGLGFIEGNCTTKKLELHSRSFIKGDLKVEKALVDGRLTCEGNVEIDRLELNGTLDITGDLKCNRITGKGSLLVNNIEVDVINLEIGNNTKVNSINASKVKLNAKENTGFFNKLMNKGEKAYIKEIDADRVQLTNIKCDKVTCAKIALEGNCEVEKKIKREAKAV